MALKFPDKDPDERLDYTIDWSRYLDTLTIASVQWTFMTHSATATTNGAVSNSTSVTLDGNDGTIGVGMTVTGTGISGTVTVSAVGSQTSITLSSAQTIGDDVTLTFASTAGVESPALATSGNNTVHGMTVQSLASTNTTATIVLSGGTANQETKFLCQITTTTNSATGAAIVTKRAVNLKVRERV